MGKTKKRVKDEDVDVVYNDIAPVEKRIYGIVAETVQTPLQFLGVPNPRFKDKLFSKLLRTEETKTIKQPAGRLIAQHGHAVSMVREHMLKKKIFEALKLKGKKQDALISLLLNDDFEPITTIVLSVRDSLELNHILNLLCMVGIPVQRFYDSNQPDYGSPSFEVMTAIATEPVTPNEVTGILDHLPLWKPKKIRKKESK